MPKEHSRFAGTAEGLSAISLLLVAEVVLWLLCKLVSFVLVVVFYATVFDHHLGTGETPPYQWLVALPFFVVTNILIFRKSSK